MEEIRCGRMTFLQFENLSRQREVQHGVFTRLGGVSRTPFASLNAGLHVGDNPLHVLENRAQIVKAMDSSLEYLTGMQQVHDTRVWVVGAEDMGRGARNWEDAVPETDAMVTNQPGALLMVLVADCAGLILYDPVRHALGVAHGGWRGTLGLIGKRTVERMMTEYGTNPADVLAGISPCIGPCCYPVSPDLAERFRKVFPGTSGVADNNRLDLRKALVSQLMDAGVPVESIEVSDQCTSCSVDLFYSYRKEGTTGRFAVIAGLEGMVDG